VNGPSEVVASVGGSNGDGEDGRCPAELGWADKSLLECVRIEAGPSVVTADSVCSDGGEEDGRFPTDVIKVDDGVFD
jgi:hypothetical protein